MPEFALAQLTRYLGLQDRVGAGRATTQVRLDRGQANVKSQVTQVLLDAATQLLSVLQGARRVVGDGAHLAGLRLDLARQGRDDVGQQLAEVAGERADAARLVGVVRVVAQHMAVFLDGHAAT